MGPSHRYQELSKVRRERAGRILRLTMTLPRPTREALQAESGMSAASIAKYTQMLTEQRILTAVSAGAGRILEYRINPDFGEFIAVVVGRTVHVTAVNAQGVITACSPKRKLSDSPLPEEFVEIAAELAHPVVEERKKAGARILSCGAAIGGYIDPVGGISHDFYHFEHWHRIPLAQRITEALDIPAFLLNDANAAALGERCFGSAQAFSDFILVWIGEGVGMGIVINGELYTGADHYAGEFGHTVVPGNDRLCFCGAVGCLETVCTEQYALERYSGLVEQVVGTGRSRPDDSAVETKPPADTVFLVEAAARGDRFALRVFNEIADVLAPKLIDAANLLNPSAIVLRGPLIDDNPHFVEALRRHVTQGVLRPAADHLSIYSGCTQKHDIMAVGAAAQALLNFLNGTGRCEAAPTVI